MPDPSNTNSRRSGLLLHATSLPGPHGVGDLGTSAFRFVDFLNAAGQAYWQLLPVGPSGSGNSPFSSLSAFAGNELLISLEKLADRGYLDRVDLIADPPFGPDRVDYDNAAKFRYERLWRAYRAFEHGATEDDRGRFESFRENHRGWLRDYVLFIALKSDNGRQAWTDWPTPLRTRDPQALAQAADRLGNEIRYREFLQFVFDTQWTDLRGYARDRGVRLIGDLPFFSGHDSADVWSHQDLFYIEPDGARTFQAAIPPDASSESGQLWGNPLYRWDVLASRGFDWWIERLRRSLDRFDVLRLDHFIGFVRTFEVAGNAQDARVGEWRSGPGSALFGKALETLGMLPFIAEDLGLVTPEVTALRDRFALPGMRVLQFGLGGGSDDSNHPRRYDGNSVAYTGNHDTDTIAGWFARQFGPDGALSDSGKTALGLSGTDGSEIHWDFIRLALESGSNTAIIPLQDVLGLGAESRMNVPGTGDGNWEWRFSDDALTGELASRLSQLTESADRHPGR